jgi:hypothetical protein
MIPHVNHASKFQHVDMGTMDAPTSTQIVEAAMTSSTSNAIGHRRSPGWSWAWVFLAFALMGASRPAARVQIGDVLREHLAVVTTDSGLTVIPHSDIKKTVDLFNTFGPSIEVRDVVAILNSDAALRVFTDHDDDIYNPNYRVLRNLLEGNYGFEVHPKAQAVISFLLAQCKDDLVEFDYHLELREGVSAEDLWLSVNLLNHEIGGTLEAVELEQLKKLERLFTGSTQGVGELYRLKDHLAYESNKVNTEFQTWLQGLTRTLPKLPVGKVEQL